MGLFKTSKSKEVIEKEPIFKKVPKSTKEIIEEIHESFYTEVDKLLADAKIMNSVTTDKQALLDKTERLRKLGFNGCRESQEAQKEINRLDTLKKENASKEALIEAINYFSFKYPTYKFITEESVKKICEKYGLVYGVVSKYIGEIPTKNLEDMEKFNISDEDIAYLKTDSYSGRWSDTTVINYATYQGYINKKKEKYNDYYIPGLRIDGWGGGLETTYSKAPLEIAAPIKDFKMTNSELRDFKISDIQIPDPVVLQPVIHKNTKYYLIVTAWGEEASDELVVNQINN